MSRYLEISCCVNPNMMNMQKMPALYRYIGLIILLVGYGAIYLTSEYIILPSDYFLVGILVVFVLSMWIGSALRRRYIRSLKKGLLTSTQTWKCLTPIMPARMASTSIMRL